MTINRIPEVEALIEAIGGEEKLFTLLPEINDREQFLEDIAMVSIWLRLNLEDLVNAKMNRKSDMKLLEDLAGELKNAREVIESLEKRLSKKMTWKASGKYGGRGWRIAGEDQVVKFTESMVQFETWVREIRVGYNHSGGQPAKIDADDAVGGLAAVWEEHTGSRPTIATDPHSYEKSGSFLELCRAMIIPVYESFSLVPPSIPSIVKNNLYPPKNKGEN